jgi:two-component system sensor histidine kinase KdpD
MDHQEQRGQKEGGTLKIYLGYAAGVGKTFSMLQEGRRLKSRGQDVAIGDIRCQDRPDIFSSIQDLEIIPKRFYSFRDQNFEEMDLQAILKRKPKYVLLDHLAHRNAPGAKNEKRFQDVLELLENQINVITTLNIENLESVADRISGTNFLDIEERVPDFLFQKAHQVINIDLSVEELRERMRSGKIYPAEKIEEALETYFSRPTLSLLRETALKEAAKDEIRRSGKKETLHQETVMVALSSDPTNGEILIRKGTRLAAQLSSPCYVVYIQKKDETPNLIDPYLNQKLQSNIKLAKLLGAETVTLRGENIAELLVNFAHEHRVRHAVLGKSRLSPIRERLRGSTILSFIHDSVGIDVHIYSTVEGEENVN